VDPGSARRRVHLIGATRVGNIEKNKPRLCAALSAALALAAPPDGSTLAEFTTKVPP
jgi:hypothetical protein